MNSIALADSWGKIWGAISGSFGGLATMLAIIGLFIILGSVGKWLWDKRKGGGGGMGKMAIPLLIGVILAGPGVIIPIFLRLLDFVVNGLIALFKVF